MEEVLMMNDCSARTCGFAEFSGRLGCTDGGSCFEATLRTVQPSDFHDAALIKATEQIQAALQAIPKDPEGRQLSFLQTKVGTVLAWVRHDVEIPSGAVTEASPEEEIIKALGIVESKAY
jgi:hypothetical protein